MSSFSKTSKFIIFLFLFTHALYAQDLTNLLIEAIGDNNVTEVKRLLASGADPNEITKVGATALIQAV